MKFGELNGKNRAEFLFALDNLAKFDKNLSNNTAKE